MALPTFVLCGSTRTVQVPADGSAVASRKPPFVPTVTVARLRPSGRRMDTRVEQQVDVPMVTSVISRLTR